MQFNVDRKYVHGYEAFNKAGELSPALQNTLLETILLDLGPRIYQYWHSAKAGVKPILKKSYTLQSTISGPPYFKFPDGVAVDRQGNMLICDTASERIQCFTSNRVFSHIIGNTTETDIALQPFDFLSPTALALDLEGNLVVAERGHHRITVLTPSGELILNFGHYGKEDGSFNTPNGIAIDMDGNILVTDDNHRVQTFSSEGVFLRSFGKKGQNPGELWYPISVAVAVNGNIFVTENLNHRVQIFDPLGNSIRVMGSVGTPEKSPDSEKLIAAAFRHSKGRLFNGPWGLALDRDSNIVVCNEGNKRVQIMSSEGEILMTLEASDQDKQIRPKGVTLDPEGNIIVTDATSDTVWIFG